MSPRLLHPSRHYSLIRSHSAAFRSHACLFSFPFSDQILFTLSGPRRTSATEKSRGGLEHK